MTQQSTAAVSIVIPGRDASRTVESCLGALLPYLQKGQVKEILFVDDGSKDCTAELVSRFPVRLVTGGGAGPGAARNLGIEEADSPLIWFVDSDCVAEPGALEFLIPHLEDQGVAAVSGSYGNMDPGSLLSTLIHEEIVERHLSMPSRVDFLATFNVIYRRSVLIEVGCFNERFITAEDADLSWR
ncbi:MAG: glycosyltransferase, partial [Acidobacteria bacterium]|nr:glycosyltransferase [Acidobacteriota bacterium]